MRQYGDMRYRVEHFRAVEVPGSELGFDYAPTGVVEEIEAPEESEAAAVALSVANDLPTLDDVDYNPAKGLYGVPGEDEAVRVTALD